MGIGKVFKSKFFKIFMAKESKAENKPEKQETKSQKANNEKRFLIIMGVLTIALIMAVVMVSFSKSKNTFELTGFTITPVPIEGTTRIYYSFPIIFQIGESKYTENMLLKVDPRLLENVSINVNSNYFASRAPIVFLFDPEVPSRVIESMYEMRRVAKMLNIQLGMAITHESTESENRTVAVMNCNESSGEVRIIYFNPNANETRVYRNDCVIIEGTNFDELERATDAFIWKWMQEISINTKK